MRFLIEFSAVPKKKLFAVDYVACNAQIFIDFSSGGHGEWNTLKCPCPQWSI